VFVWFILCVVIRPSFLFCHWNRRRQNLHACVHKTECHHQSTIYSTEIFCRIRIINVSDHHFQYVSSCHNQLLSLLKMLKNMLKVHMSQVLWLYGVSQLSRCLIGYIYTQTWAPGNIKIEYFTKLSFMDRYCVIYFHIMLT